jgi:arylformamidase
MATSAKIIDLSVPIDASTITWEDESTPLIERVDLIEKDGYNLSRLRFGSHTGTHVDAPEHFIGGATTVDEMPLDVLIGPVQVVDARDVEEEIGPDLVERELEEGSERVIFATRNSELWKRPKFTFDFVDISPDASALLVERGVRLVGIDYLSVGPVDTHLELLSHGIVLLEGLDLTDVSAGKYRLFALPLRIAGCDGAPARAVLTSL